MSIVHSISHKQMCGFASFCFSAVGGSLAVKSSKNMYLGRSDLKAKDMVSLRLLQFKVTSQVNLRSRLTKGQHLQPGYERVRAAAHKYTRSLIHCHMRIHPLDLANPIPFSGRWRIFFLVMCFFLASGDCIPFL